jgi:hypothetical protein
LKKKQNIYFVFKAHNHSHGGGGNISIAFFLNLSFTVIELIGGIFTNSIAIISDAVHDFGDSLSLGLAWYFQKLSKKGSTKQYSTGINVFRFEGRLSIPLFWLWEASIFCRQQYLACFRRRKPTRKACLYWRFWELLSTARRCFAPARQVRLTRAGRQCS